MRKICPNCKNTSADKWGEIPFNNSAYSDKSSLYECLKCGLFFVNPRPNEKLLSKIYSGHYHYAANPIQDWFVRIYIFLTDFQEDIKLIKAFKKNGRILDIGAGRGDLISFFDSKDYEKWVYDPYLSKRDLDDLRTKTNKINDFNSLPEYPDEYFDVVILRNVIEHTVLFKQLIKEIHKKLKKGGIVFIRTPNIDSADFRIFKTDWYQVKMPGHIVFFNSKCMVNVLKNEDFRILHNKATGRSMPLSLSRSIGPRIFKLLEFPASILFSLVSPLMGEGGELVAIAKK